MNSKYLGLGAAVLVVVAVGAAVAFTWKQAPKNTIPEVVEMGSDLEQEESGKIVCDGKVDAKVTIENGVNGTAYQHTVSMDGNEVLTIDTVETMNFPESEASLYRQTDCFAYVTISPVGLGGYILYGGPRALYRIDLRDGSSKDINMIGFFSDLSSDESMVVSVMQENVVQIQVTTVETGRTRTFSVPSPYNDAGSAQFSPDGMKVAYGAVQRNENGEPEAQAVITIDLSTGKQTITAAKVRPKYPVYITGWTKGGLPIASDTF